MQFLEPILRQRREQCEQEPEAGLPDFICFDNGPAYSLYALAAVGEVWPEKVYGSSTPPCTTPTASRLHSTLRRDAVHVVSDPPHRRWHWQAALPNNHPDFAEFDRCLGFALGRISAPTCVLSPGDIALNSNFRLYPEDDTLLVALSKLSSRDDMASAVKVLTKAAWHAYRL